MKAALANHASTKFDFSYLVDLRSAHETHQAENCCRTQQNTVPECASQKKGILRAFNAILLKTNRGEMARIGTPLATAVWIMID